MMDIAWYVPNQQLSGSYQEIHLVSCAQQSGGRLSKQHIIVGKTPKRAEDSSTPFCPQRQGVRRLLI